MFWPVNIGGSLVLDRLVETLDLSLHRVLLGRVCADRTARAARSFQFTQSETWASCCQASALATSIFSTSHGDEPTKPTEPPFVGFVGFVGSGVRETEFFVPSEEPSTCS